MRPYLCVAAFLLVSACSRETPPGGASTAVPADRPAAETPARATPAKDATPPAPGILAEALGGWSRDGSVQRFGPGNLWEYIDGGAEQFLSFGFQDLESAKYTLAGGLSATVDAYRMVDRLHAFGIYVQETNPKRQPLPIGVEGRAGTAAVEFWSGRHYVKLVASPAGPPASAAIVSLAKAVSAALGDAGPLPAEIGLFPTKGLVAGSVRLVPEDALGQAAFSGALEAKYQGVPKPWTLLLVPFATPDLAAESARDYAAFLAQGGPAASPLASAGDGGFTVADRYYGRIVAARQGKWLLISLGAQSEGAATALLKAAAARVSVLPSSPSAEGTR